MKKSLLKKEAYQKLLAAYRKLGRALASRERLGYDAIFQVMYVIDNVMTAAKSWEYPATKTTAGKED